MVFEHDELVFVEEFQQLAYKLRKRFIWLVVITFIASFVTAGVISANYPNLSWYGMEWNAFLNGVTVSFLGLIVFALTHYRILFKYWAMSPRYHVIVARQRIRGE